VVVERRVDRVVGGTRVVGQFEHVFGPAKAVPAVVVDDALLERRVGRRLVHRVDRRVDLQARRVDVLVVQVEGELAGELRDVGRVHRVVGARRREHESLGHRRLVLCLREEVRLAHAPEDVALALDRARRVDHRVEARRRLRQPREHGRLGSAQLREWLVEVGARRRGEAVRALAEVDLVQIQLEDLLLAQRVLDAQREQDLDDLARVGALVRQEELARELHRDRARTLLLAAGEQVRHRGARHADRVDADVLEEAGVLGGEHGVLHHLRHVLDVHEGASLLAELADQLAVGRVHAQRNARTVVEHRVERRQPVVEQQQRERTEQRAAEAERDRNRDRRRADAQPDGLFRGGLRAGLSGVACGHLRAYPAGTVADFIRIDRCCPPTACGLRAAVDRRTDSNAAQWSVTYDRWSRRAANYRTKRFTVNRSRR
jgi:hypothetical protein